MYKIKMDNCTSCTQCDSLYGSGFTQEDIDDGVVPLETVTAEWAMDYTPCPCTYDLELIGPREVLKHIVRSTHCPKIKDTFSMFTVGGMLGDDNRLSFSTAHATRGAVRFDGPYLPHWILHPRVADEHILRQIEQLKQDNWIPAALYDMWLDVSVPDYSTDYVSTSYRHRLELDEAVEAATSPDHVLHPSLTPEAARDRLSAALPECGKTGRDLFFDIVKHEVYDTDDGVEGVGDLMDGKGYLHLVTTNLWHEAAQLAQRMHAQRRIAFLPRFTAKWTCEKWSRTIFTRMFERGGGDDIPPHCTVLAWLQELDSVVEPRLKEQGFSVVRLSPKQYVSDRYVPAVEPTLVYAFPTLGKSYLLDATKTSGVKRLIEFRVCQNTDKQDHGHLFFNRIPHPGLESKETKAVLRALFPVSSDADGKHSRLRIMDGALSILGRDEPYRKKLARLNSALLSFPVGTTEVYATGMLSYNGLSDMGVRQSEFLVENNLCGLFDLEAVVIHKAISNTVRRTARWVNGDNLDQAHISQVVGADLFCGRSRHLSNWVQEIENRTSRAKILNYVDPETGSPDRGLDKLKKALDRIIPFMVQHAKTRNRSWDVFVHSRQNWLAGGSACGAKVTPIDGKSDLPKQLNKRILMEYLTAETIISWLDEEVEPAIIGSASEKNENGKARAIYGTDIKGYTIMSYVLSIFEPEMHRVPDLNEGESGYDEIVNMKKRAAATNTSGMYTAMADYQDFNIQHTLEAQAAVFESFENCLLKRGGCEPSLMKAIIWCKKAMLNQYVYFPGPDERPKTYAAVQELDGVRVSLPTCEGARPITQGLLSGLRGTNFINTILNKAYLLVAVEDVERIYGVKDPGSLKAHKGDDLWLCSYSSLWQALVFRQMKRAGLLFQTIKQLFSTRGEYLRVGYYLGETYGYLCRAIAGWMIGPIQSGRDIDFITSIQDVCRSAATVYRRGGDANSLDALRAAAIRRLCKVTLRVGGTTKVVRVPQKPLGAAFAQGGIDLGGPGTFANPQYAAPYLPRWQQLPSVKRLAVPSHMSSDQVSILWNVLDLGPQTAAAIQRVYHDQNTAAVEDDEVREKEDALFGVSVMSWIEQVNRRRRPIPPRGKWTKGNPNHDDLCGQLAEMDCSAAWDHIFVNYIPQGDAYVYFKPKVTHMGIVDRAIRISPYRDLATVAIQTSGDQVSLARVAINSVADIKIRNRAVTSLHHLLLKLGREVLNRVLLGFRGDGTALAYYVSPTILSYLNQISLECLMEGSQVGIDATPKQWSWMSAIVMHSLLSFVARHTSWLSLSRL